ncbi:MAG: hypothetical protein HWN68_13840 [Desulfobacterales bacterium]|nr:hypothetical protein [Desulfobacterales bacterium]
MKFNPVILFSVFLIIVFAFAVFEAKDFAFAGRLFPLIVGIPALILTLVQFFLDLRAKPEGDEVALQDFVDIAPDVSIPLTVVRTRALRFLCWILGLYLGIWVVGFKIAVPLFFIAFMRVEGRARWLLIISLTALSVYAIFYHFEELLGVFWPKPVISRWVEIPWLF